MTARPTAALSEAEGRGAVRTQASGKLLVPAGARGAAAEAG